MMLPHDAQMEHPDWQGDVLPKNWFSWRSLWAFTGPGALMSIAYIDPGVSPRCPNLRACSGQLSQRSRARCRDGGILVGIGGSGRSLLHPVAGAQLSVGIAAPPQAIWSLTSRRARRRGTPSYGCSCGAPSWWAARDPVSSGAAGTQCSSSSWSRCAALVWTHLVARVMREMFTVNFFCVAGLLHADAFGQAGRGYRGAPGRTV